jgi:hypothetical protein
VLTAEKAAEKAQRKKGLRFYASQIAYLGIDIELGAHERLKSSLRGG